MHVGLRAGPGVAASPELAEELVVQADVIYATLAYGRVAPLGTSLDRLCDLPRPRAHVI